ncbi:gastrula zinc finger protein XlCGF8.2DB-like [Drosophila busckii]|uniref:gastrula zinc finger protein XlCGF8.2DB-like n=1 Tax=Drosophila busckii TaxID=30019 RepID=UPI00083E97A9|nr:gastrula zinc finger protein XlCGF8.2DB-like [Drosophila busckii]
METCGIFLSKEPYNEWAIQCFICEDLYYTLQEFQTHQIQTHLDIVEETRESCEELQELEGFISGVLEPMNLELLDDIINDIIIDDNEVEQLYETLLKTDKKEQNLNSKCSWKCSTCFKTFTRRFSLARHELSHAHLNGFLCDKCGVEMKDRHQMREHMRQEHEEKRPFQCGKCPRNYARKTHLKDHMRSHSVQRDFACGICERKFKRSQELTRHKRLHQLGKQYSCSLCDARFRQCSGLYGHMRRKHGLVTSKDIAAIL